ncbi:MAG: ATP-binding protein [Verrucomicrobia bacterium]|nr:ATP-binding protein [Verrucomicrobiota bacterium]
MPKQKPLKSERRADTAAAIPTKQFFVSMLTRDISLADAILDLIDNCLDGALRIAGKKNPNYSKHTIKIDLSGDEFAIEDDCGGIPREIAIKYAFKMGREPDDDRDADAETIGMYGVGMKRAIFKMGRDSLVRTLFDGDAFEVPISSAWLDNKDWEPLPMKDSPPETRLKKPGTRIEVRTLHPSVSRHFKNDGFINELRSAIGEHFTVFIQRGLKILVKGEETKPVMVELLVAPGNDDPAPFIFTKCIDGVEVSIAVGLNTGREPSEADDEEETSDFERNRSTITAGWTVFCNDRAVIVGDKSRLTGWGDSIPLYHYQFSVITGIVEFRSASAEKLPVTTTKRALDTSSNVWLETVAKMKEGLRVWINHTNAWKNHPRSSQAQIWENAEPMSLHEAVETVLKRGATQRADGSHEYNPAKRKVLPHPPGKTPSSRRIVFSRPIEEIRDVSKALFDREDEKPGIVGEKCFELALARSRKRGA